MKNIATVNTVMPSIESSLEYFSGESLRDYDIAIFDPGLPHLDRVHFDGGGSCLTIESTQQLKAAMAHWAEEIRGALSAGKTIFVLLDDSTSDKGASGYTTKTKQRTYSTFSLNNYEALPIAMGIKNSKGRVISVVDSRFGPLLKALEKLAGYKVVFETAPGKTIFATKDGAAVACMAQISGLSGHLVFIPYFDLVAFDADHGDTWSKEATRISLAIVAQFVAIDKMLSSGSDETPEPDWVQSQRHPTAVGAIDVELRSIDADITALQAKKSGRLRERSSITSFAHLLYENGKVLEAAIERALSLLGYKVENFQNGDIEIDHLITSPDGTRMIGESEGKDASAIDITKFRQLETNINEDFARPEVDLPAKGILFGNGYRLSEPSTRAEQFTAKCLTNAARLGTALVRTSDLYPLVVYLIDHPDDEAFKNACRQAIESCTGKVVVFPQPEFHQRKTG